MIRSASRPYMPNKREEGEREGGSGGGLGGGRDGGEGGRERGMVLTVTHHGPPVVLVLA